MERAFTYDKFNTFYDWRLVLSDKSVTPPEAKTNYVELDGMSGTLDLSESLTGEITYKDRTVTASFWTNEGNRNEREKLLRDITARLHGKKVKIIEPDDLTHYFFGRCKITSNVNTLPYASFNIEAICEPWRYSINECVRVIDVNNDSKDVVINNNGVKTLCPTLTITGTIKLIYNDITTSLTTGEYKISDLKLKSGVNVVGVSGKGSVTFTYREADL